MINDGEDLLRAAASVTDEGFNAACSRFQDKLRDAKANLADANHPILDSTRDTALVDDR